MIGNIEREIESMCEAYRDLAARLAQLPGGDDAERKKARVIAILSCALLDAHAAVSAASQGTRPASERS